MRPMAAVVLIAFSCAFLFHRYRVMTAPPAKQTPPPALERTEPAPFLSLGEIKRLRVVAKDPDPNVRWATMELLFMVKDPESIGILQKAVINDPDRDLRIKSIQLLEKKNDLLALAGLIRGILDIDKDVRLAALKSAGAIGDPAATPWVMEALKDIEPEVRGEALLTLGQFQDKRKTQYAEVIARLRAQYEAEVKRQKERHELGKM